MRRFLSFDEITGEKFDQMINSVMNCSIIEHFKMKILFIPFIDI